MEKINTKNNSLFEDNYQEKYENFIYQIKNKKEINETDLTERDLELFKLANYAIDRCLDGIIFAERVEEVSKYKNRLEYPLVDGISISPFELDLPKSKLDLNNPNNYNLHHNSWTKYKFGKATLYIILRRLENNQYALPIDTHAKLHRIYNPPEMPSPTQAMNAIEYAASHDIRLQTGSVQRPKYKKIDNSTYADALKSYEKLTELA